MERNNSTDSQEASLHKLKEYRDELSIYESFSRISGLISELTVQVHGKASKGKQSIYSIVDQIKCLVQGISVDAEDEKRIGKKIVAECIQLDRAMLQKHLPSAIRIHIRWMIRRDMPEVLDIEHQCFEFPWSEEDFIRCLRQRNCIGMVAEVEKQVLGFMIYELFKERLHLLNFAVDEWFRRYGIGRNMINKLKMKLSSTRRTNVMLEVRETNLPAQLFFKRMGFEATNILRDFYEDTTEDAYVMKYALPRDEGDDENSF